MTARGQRRSPGRGTVRSLLLMAAVLFLVLVGTRALLKLEHGVPPSQLPLHLAPWVILWGVAVLVFVPGLLLAERAAISRGRARPYAFLILGGAALVVAVTTPLWDWIGFPAPFWIHPPVAVPRQLLPFLDVVLRMGLACLIYAGHRERLDAVQAVQVLQTRRDEMMGRLAASRLEAAGARVPPEAFIAELRTIRATYFENPAAGGTELDSLITRLRAVSRPPLP